MDYLEERHGQLVAQRGNVGAFLSRADYAVTGLLSMSENYKAAESQISDADVAYESAQLVRGQILQNAAQAVLAQANQQPALALRVLGNL